MVSVSKCKKSHFCYKFTNIFLFHNTILLRRKSDVVHYNNTTKIGRKCYQFSKKIAPSPDGEGAAEIFFTLNSVGVPNCGTNILNFTCKTQE